MPRAALFKDSGKTSFPNRSRYDGLRFGEKTPGKEKAGNLTI